MSLFGSFSSHRTSKDSTARTVIDVGDLPNFALADLVNKDEIVLLLPPLVRPCYGCSQSLKPGGAIANPPYDM